TANMFDLLGVAPALGRTFAPNDIVSPAAGEVVISDGLWQRRFASKSDAIGQTILLDGDRYTVIGVMPKGFKFAPFWATRAELWAPMPLAGRSKDFGMSLRVFGRLADGVTIEQARRDVAVVTTRLEQQFPGTNREVTVQPLLEKVVG